MPLEVDATTMRRLFMHEAQVHAMPGRDLRDLGDAILLHDPIDPEPFWNRLAAIRWPADPGAFDRRLTEIFVLFASLAGNRTSGRPRRTTRHRTSSPGSWRTGSGTWAPGRSWLWRSRDAVMSRGAPELPPAVTLQSVSGLSGPPADDVARAIVEVLADAFDVVADREPGVRAETLASLRHSWFTHYLVRSTAGRRPSPGGQRSTA